MSSDIGWLCDSVTILLNWFKRDLDSVMLANIFWVILTKLLCILERRIVMGLQGQAMKSDINRGQWQNVSPPQKPFTAPRCHRRRVEDHQNRLACRLNRSMNQKSSRGSNNSMTTCAALASPEQTVNSNVNQSGEVGASSAAKQS